MREIAGCRFARFLSESSALSSVRRIVPAVKSEGVYGFFGGFGVLQILNGHRIYTLKCPNIASLSFCSSTASNWMEVSAPLSNIASAGL
jgi:hypothetical protein